MTGHDNVHITAGKAREGYGAAVSGCTVCAVYGVGGAADRVFLSGNAGEAMVGMDWYSAYDDPTYFPDTNYTRLSRDGSRVAGYAILNNTLATFLQGSTDGRNVVVRTGSLDSSGEALFRITNTLIGQDAAAPGTFALAGKEPLFLTERGVYAITAEELTGEKYSQERSCRTASAERSSMALRIRTRSWRPWGDRRMSVPSAGSKWSPAGGFPRRDTGT